jgi:hypothetical protein
LVNPASRFDARELFATLARHDVDYVTVGGIAIQAYGGQRITQDLDVVVAASAENFERLASALADLDARVLNADGRRSSSAPKASLLASSDLWHLITVHGALDIVTLPAHLGPFEEMRARAHETSLGDVIVPIAHRKDLLKMKRASGRPQDLADVEFLESLDDESG